jgi:hypothetical protein
MRDARYASMAVARGWLYSWFILTKFSLADIASLYLYLKPL